MSKINTVCSDLLSTMIIWPGFEVK